MAAGWLGADDAAARLGVKVETLYAYAARGQVRRRTRDGRRSEYAVDDLDRLAVRGRRGAAVRRAPLAVRSEVTVVDPEHGPTYRGQAATRLAGAMPFEEVAALLWQVDDEGPWRAPRAAVTAGRGVLAVLPDLGPVDRLPVLVTAAAAVDPLRHDRSPGAVVGAARGLLATLVATAVDGGDDGTAGPLAARLARAVAPRRRGGARLLDAALVLLADHELAASTLAARAAASTRSGPYEVVLAGLAVVRGPRHGMASARLEGVLRRIGEGRDPLVALAEESGERAPGFGHPLYDGGDPRARRLLALVRELGPRTRVADVETLLHAALGRGLPPPDVDLALAAVTHVLGAPVGTGGLVFSLARTVGWVAHALEQYDQPGLLRPRAIAPAGPA